MRIIPFSVLGSLALMLTSCSTITIQNVQYGWPVEVVGTVDHSNHVVADRYGLTFSVAKIAEREMQDSSALAGKIVHVLRNDEGYYFVTGPGFKHVYVFAPGTHQLSTEEIIEVTETGLQNPRLNLRPPYVELLDNDGFHKLLTHSAIAEGNSK
ncbi:MAG: hypothetical protein WB699_02195 [Bacteroidota bacterium]